MEGMFPRKFLQKLIPPTCAEVNQPTWKHPPISMELNLLPLTSMEVAMDVASSSSSIYTSMEVASFHASNSGNNNILACTSMYFHGSWYYSRPASMEVASA